MKIIHVFLLALCVVLVSGNAAFSQTTYKSQFPMKLDSSGTLTDASGTTYATISKEAIIRNHAGEKIAFIDQQGNLVGDDGKTLGKASKNGDFHNTKGEVEYVVKSSKSSTGYYDVYDAMGKHVLTVPANYKAQAGSIAYMHKKMMLAK